MVKKNKVLHFTPHEHLEYWVTKTTYEHRLQWLDEARKFIFYLRKKKKF